MVPPDGATGVPPQRARWPRTTRTSTEYLGEDVVLVHPDGSEQLLDATWDATEQLLSVVPSSSALTANSSYEIRWPVLRGLNAAAPGLGGNGAFHDRRGVRHRAARVRRRGRSVVGFRAQDQRMRRRDSWSASCSTSTSVPPRTTAASAA